MRPPLPPPQLSVTAESPHRGAAGTRRRQQHLIAHPGSKRIPPHLQPRRSLPPPGFIKPDLEESGPSAARALLCHWVSSSGALVLRREENKL